LNGDNACVFLYGNASTSGKQTHLTGPGSDKGILCRTIGHAFNTASELASSGSKVSVFLSTFEVWCDQVKQEGKVIPIVDGVGGYGTLPSLRVREISSPAETMELIQGDLLARQQTYKDDDIQRSVFVVQLTFKQSNTSEGLKQSYFNMVDLGFLGPKPPETDRTKTKVWQLASKTLSTLASTSSTLFRGSDELVPFKVCSLTRVLHSSMDKTSRSLFFGCVKPTAAEYDSNYNTLVFVNSCRNGQPLDSSRIQAVGPAEQDLLVRKLKGEVGTLQEQLAAAHEYYHRKIADLKRAVAQAEASSTASGEPPTPAPAPVPAPAPAPVATNRRQSVAVKGGASLSHAVTDEEDASAGTEGNMASFLSKQYQNEIRELKDKLNKRSAELRELREGFTTADQSLRLELEAQRSKASQLQQDLRDYHDSMEEKVADLKSRHEKEVAALTANNHRLLAEMNETMDQLPDNFKQASQQVLALQTQKGDERAKVEGEYKTVIKQMDESKDSALEQQRAQYEFWASPV
jgi:hypothetical protein